MVVRGDIARRGAGRQLIIELDRSGGTVAFSRRYDAAPLDMPQVQRSVVTDVVAALNVKLTSADYERLQRAPACRADAYVDYATGRALLNREDVPGNAAQADEATAELKRAIEMRPANVTRTRDGWQFVAKNVALGIYMCDILFDGVPVLDPELEIRGPKG
jgi:hypothetical protein